jgi:hypothetical protein
MTEQEQKTQFAVAVLKNKNDWWKAAFSIIKDDGGKAMWIADHWQFDEFVLKEIARLKEDGFGVETKDKNEAASVAWDMATNENLEPKDRIAALELHSKIMGHIERPTVNNGIINNSNKVMIVPVPYNESGQPMNAEEFERTAALSQKVLQGN